MALEKENFLDKIIGALLISLRAKATIIEAKTAVETHAALQKKSIAVLGTDAAITDTKHRSTAQVLTQYA